MQIPGLLVKNHDESRQGEALILPNTPLGNSRKLYLESYGCAMNFSDSEIVASIMAENGFTTTSTPDDADVIFINTCSIRDNAEVKVRNRLKEFGAIKRTNKGLIVGVLGCMAERLKSKFLEEEKLVDIVVGPDAYRDIPNLIFKVDGGERSVNVLLSREETYADISPVRLGSNGVSAYVSIMRGCDNMCSFCVVPYTRGRERSRNPESIVKEILDLSQNGYKEIILLGQNVDSYKWQNEEGTEKVNFSDLLEKCALVDTKMRIRFSTSHPKDITDEVLYTIAKYDNICKYIHLPIQSGSTPILEKMNRTYTQEWYKNRIEAIRQIIPGCAISTDIITGFCSETEDDHLQTLHILDWVKFDFAYMFKYSERPGTPAAKRFEDDVPEEIKQRRLEEVVDLQRKNALVRMEAQIGEVQQVLIEGVSKKSKNDFTGRNDGNSKVVFPKKDGIALGDFVMVRINTCTSATLIGEIID